MSRADAAFLAWCRHRLPDPVVDFAGGPGGSAVSDDIPVVLDELLGLNQNRDLVFIDQRGTGGSNPLDCPAFPSTLSDRRAPPDRPAGQLRPGGRPGEHVGD